MEEGREDGLFKDGADAGGLEDLGRAFLDEDGEDLEAGLTGGRVFAFGYGEEDGGEEWPVFFDECLLCDATTIRPGLYKRVEEGQCNVHQRKRQPIGRQ